MNNNINSNRVQSKLSPNEIKATLGFATKLSEGLLGDSSQDASQSPQNAPGGAQMSQEPQSPAPDQNEAKIAELEIKMDQMKTEMELMMKNEISSIKDIIKEALKEDEQK